MDYNTCDKCGKKHFSEDLIRITSEDFEPREDERVPKKLYKKYDALCNGCYMSEITIVS